MPTTDPDQRGLFVVEFPLRHHSETLAADSAFPERLESWDWREVGPNVTRIVKRNGPRPRPGMRRGVASR